MEQPCPPVIRERVRQFGEQLDTYKLGDYSEAQLRVDFLNPMLEALGWDVNNAQGFAEAYRDVVYEDAVKVGGTKKAPDYGFYIGGRAAGAGARKFFLEAKKPAINLRKDPGPAYQLRRYAWTAGLPLSILSDFEEFIVYDCRVKPLPSDHAATAAILSMHFTEYATRWHEIAAVFSRDAILRGSFDRFAQRTKKKRGTALVDESFLEEIEQWRADLAANLALRNPDISHRDLNFAVQRTIDRVIFLRMCEDRGIEPTGSLMALLNGDKVYQRLGQIFRRADERYNSGLFHFAPEKGRDELPDELTLDLDIDDRVLKGILKRLYDSPYEFSVMPPEILGQVYEQFLGKVIRLTAAHRATIEDKPEVRKAGGVYYTPAYIVDFIVRNTVEKLLSGVDPKGATKLRILDPACGSGSFLIGAYQYLLDWHLRWYLEHEPQEHCKGSNPPLKQVVRANGSEPVREGPAVGAQPGHRALDYHLTTAKRKSILLNSIFGVDIDPQAVEVTKLSLLLKVLEGESQDSIESQYRLFHQRALPDLGRNIKCGNSLIGPQFYDNEQLELDEEERIRINVFDWNSEFRDIMRAGGFDAVIGNPPYVNAWELFANEPHIRAYINEGDTYQTADRHWDLYVLFLERAWQLVRKDGRLSFIIPFSYAIQKYAQASRNLFLSRTRIESIADLRTVRVFGRVPIITIIPVIKKTAPTKDSQVLILRPGSSATRDYAGTIEHSHSITQRRFIEQHEQMLRLDLSDAGFDLCQRIETRSVRVGDICWVSYGAQMSSRKKGGFGKDSVIRDNHQTETCRPMVSGRELYRYELRWAGRYVEWALADQMYGARHPKFFECPKIMIRDITGTHRLEVAADETAFYCDHTILCAQRAIDAVNWRAIDPAMVELSRMYSLDLLQGLLASRLVSAYCYLTLTGEGVRIGGGFHTYPQTVRRLPVFNVASAAPVETHAIEQIEQKAAILGQLHRRLRAAKAPADKERLPREIEVTDRQIDQLVYGLYGLSDEEIRIVESATESAPESE